MTLNMIPEHFTYLPRHGKNSRRLKSRCVVPHFELIPTDCCIYASSGRYAIPIIPFVLEMLIACLQIKQNHYDTVCNIARNATSC